MPANGGEAIQVTRDGGFAPLESPDRKFVYYLKRLQDAEVWKISTDGAEVTKVLEGLSDYRNLAVLESGLVFVSIRSTSSLEFLNFATGKIRTLANVDRSIFNLNYSGLAVSPDGQSILYAQIEQAGSEGMLVQNPSPVKRCRVSNRSRQDPRMPVLAHSGSKYSMTSSWPRARK